VTSNQTIATNHKLAGDKIATVDSPLKSYPGLLISVKNLSPTWFLFKCFMGPGTCMEIYNLYQTGYCQVLSFDDIRNRFIIKMGYGIKYEHKPEIHFT
jgi:hypothetical protein